MTDAPKAVAAEEDRFSGFSSDELLRRARVLRQVAEREHPREGNYIFNSLDKPEGVNYLGYIEQRR